MKFDTNFRNYSISFKESRKEQQWEWTTSLFISVEYRNKIRRFKSIKCWMYK